MAHARAALLLVALAAATPTRARAQSTPPEPRDGAPRVHLEGAEPGTTLFQVTLQLRVRGRPAGVMARPVCQAPCDRIIDGLGGQRFFFAGEGLTTSSQFQLLGKGPDLRVDVVPGSSRKRMGGYVMGAFGGAALLGGLTTLALGALSTTVIDATATSRATTVASPSTVMMATGGAVAGAGLGLLIGGILMVTHSRTAYRFLQPGPTPVLMTF